MIENMEIKNINITELYPMNEKSQVFKSTKKRIQLTFIKFIDHSKNIIKTN